MRDYRQELERRTAQFAGYLKKMYHRAHDEVQGNCFIIFEERKPSDGTDGSELTEAVKPALQLAGTAFDNGVNSSIITNGKSPNFDLPDEGWREDNSQNRFIQFSIERNWFCLDMPLQTLFRAEAEQILRDRMGFFYLKNRSEFTLSGEDVDGYDPFRKVYVYGDEDSAAEDMAFIFFQVWKFPVDWRFFVKAAAFGDKKTDWEKGVAIE